MSRSAAAMYPAFWCGRVAAGLDEIRGRLPIIRASSKLSVFFGLYRPRSDRSCHRVKEHLRSSWKLSAPGSVVVDLSSASSVHRAPRSSGHTIGLIAAEHGPDDARELVGHCSNGDVERSSGDQTIDPRPETTVTAGREPDQRSGAVDQLSAQISITALADPQQPFSAPG